MTSEENSIALKSKRIWISLLSLLGITILCFVLYRTSPLLFLSIYQGNGTSINEHYIETGLQYIYTHNKSLNRVSVRKADQYFSDYDWDYHLVFEKEKNKEVPIYVSQCKLPRNSCNSKSFENFEAISLKYFSEPRKDYFDFTYYFKNGCGVFISHMDKPYDPKYFDMTKKFFGTNCNEKTHNK